MEKVILIASRHWKALLGFNLLVLVATIGTIVTAPRVWTATSRLILPASDGGNLDVNLGTLGSYSANDPSFSTQVNPLKIQQEILSSDALLEQAWLADPEYNQSKMPGSYGQFFSVSPVEQTSIMLLTVDGATPEVAQQRAIALLKTYQNRLNELRQANNATRENFSQKQLEQARKRLADAQTDLAKFKQSTGLVDSEEQTKGIVETINALNVAQAQAQAQAQASGNQARALSSRLNLAPQEAIQSLGLDQNEDYKFLRSKLTEMEAKIAGIRAYHTNDSPILEKFTFERDQLRNQLQRYVRQAAGQVQVDTTVTSGAEGRVELIQQLVLAESQAIGQQRQAEQLRNRILQLNTSLKSLPAKQARLVELQRQADVAEGVYKGLVTQVQQSNIDAFNAYPNVQVLDPPKVNPKPSKKSTTAINALLASIVGSIALVLLLEARNPLLSPKDLQAIKFPLVVRIPRLRQLKSGLDFGAEPEVEFHRLASAISLQALKDHRLLIASAMMGEGKTTITLRLATALTDLGFRVLVVDGDFRKAELSRRLKHLWNYAEEHQVVQVQPNLDLLPTMPKQGRIMDLVARGRFEQYLATAQSAKGYDYVLVDSAPVSFTSETALMASVIPNVLFIVRPSISARNAVNDALEQLGQHNAKVIGLVVNSVETQSRSYPYKNTALVNS
jgi:polysaccharide biosynthesis transport protein